MSTTTALLLVGVAGAGIWFYMRQQQQQQLLLAAAAAQASGGGGGGGGIGGLLGRVVDQWKQDPLGIANAKAVIGGATDVIKNAAHEVESLFGGIF